MSLRVNFGTPVFAAADAASLDLDAMRALFEPSVGTPVPPPMAPSPDLTEEALVFEPDTLPIPLQEQKNPVWCYAACAAMAINFLHQQEKVTQCNVVSLIKKDRDHLDHCCTNFDIVCVLSGCKVEDVGRIFKEFAVDFEPSAGSVNDVQGPVDFAKLQSEFNAKRPVEVVIEWPNGGKHALLMAGIRGPLLYLLDPLQGHPYNGWRTIASLEHFNEQGKWIKTWPGLSKTPAPPE